MRCWVVKVGLIDYRSALGLQENLVALRLESKIPDVLLLLEHPHTYTFGRRINPSYLLLSNEDLEKRGINLFSTDRGGDITYHGPGQLVAYPIMKVGGITRIKDYLANLEQVLIDTALAFGVSAQREPGLPGIWVGSKKLASVGLKVTGGVSKHGFALNVSTDLSYFEGIVPCGLQGKDVTSLSDIMGREVALQSVQEPLIKNFGATFIRDMMQVNKDMIFSLAQTTKTARASARAIR